MIDVERSRHCRQCYPLVGGSGLYKLVSCANHGEQGNKQHTPILSALVSVLGPYPEFLSGLPSMMDSHPGSVSLLNPFLLQVVVNSVYHCNWKHTRACS